MPLWPNSDTSYEGQSHDFNFDSETQLYHSKIVVFISMVDIVIVPFQTLTQCNEFKLQQRETRVISNPKLGTKSIILPVKSNPDEYYIHHLSPENA